MTTQIKRYVVGFVFDYRMEHGGQKRAPPTSVLLVRKAKPRWQEGKYTGPGGSIEAGETDAQAIAREMEEESAGVLKIAPEAWRHFATLEGDEVYNPPNDLAPGVKPGFQVEMFCTYADLAAMHRAEADTRETIEPLRVMTLVDVLTAEGGPGAPLPNVAWLIGMALGESRGDSSERFIIREISARS